MRVSLAALLHHFLCSQLKCTDYPYIDRLHTRRPINRLTVYSSRLKTRQTDHLGLVVLLNIKTNKLTILNANGLGTAFAVVGLVIQLVVHVVCRIVGCVIKNASRQSTYVWTKNI